MAKKDTVFTMRMTEGRKFAFDAIAKQGDLTLSELFQKGAILYGQMPKAFLDEVSKMAEDMEIPVSTLIIHNFQRWVASIRAYQMVFDCLPPGWDRAFQRDPKNGNMIKGDNLSKILLSEYIELFESLKQNLLESKKVNEPCFVSREQVAEFVAQL